MASSSPSIYFVVNDSNIESPKSANKTVAPKQSRQTSFAMAADGEGPSSFPSTTTTPIYSLATTKAVKPANKTLVPRLSLQINLQRQRQQQQIQQIRAIRRKRTVAFAVNHVVSADSAPDLESAHTVLTKIINAEFGHSTVNWDCLCTFQQNASGFGEEYHVKENTNRGEKKELPSHLNSNAKDGAQNFCNDSKVLKCENNNNKKEKKLNQKNRLVVHVRCAEAAAAAISSDIALATSSSCHNCRSSPVPVTPTYLPPCVNEINTTTANTSTESHRAGMPSKKQRSCPNPEKEGVPSLPTSRSSEFPAKLSKNPKVKRVRYDMECVPAVKINRSLWGDVSIRPSRSHCDDNINNNNINHLAQPASNLLLQGSVLWIPSSREEWEDCVSEMKAICTSAAFRRWSKNLMKDYENSIRKITHANNSTSSQAVIAAHPLRFTQHSGTTMSSFTPPLSQAFIKDRFRIDDPLRGYQIRHAKGGWLQGFLVWTNFTVWTLDFQWDSNHPASGLLQHGGKSEDPFDARDDGTLSKELQGLPRGEQDPLDGGIVLKQVAEISLLGGLGCGEVLLRKAIEDIRKSENSDNCKYEYVVLQATEGSRKFYEKMGFLRVGAVCRYRWAEYCTNDKGSVSTRKKLDVKKVQATGIDPKFHGYRHWTYTNESSKSLNAHGGPSVMMCLRLDEIIKENIQHGNRQTISELLQSHVVHEKPIIQLFGNVTNPESENVAPTRKSKRRCSGSGSLRGTQQEHQENKTKVRISAHLSSENRR
jgi:hypothetical protein